MKTEPTKFIAMWDNTGLECILDVTKHEKEIEDFEKQKAWSILKGDVLHPVKPPSIPLQMMILRAKATANVIMRFMGLPVMKAKNGLEIHLKATHRL